jgi:hypothetical protein
MDKRRISALPSNLFLKAVGETTMVTKPIVWKALDQHQPMACFIQGCREKAGHFGKIRYGEAVFHVCLCHKCQSKSVRAILEGLTMRSAWGDKTKADQEKRCTEEDVKVK